MIINVSEVNRRIKELNSLEKVAQELGTSRRSLNRHLSKFYTYKEKQYVAIAKDAPIEIDTDANTKRLEAPRAKKEVSIGDNIPQTPKSDLETRVAFLEEKVSEIYSIVSKSSTRPVEKFEIDGKVLVGKTTTRSFKANETIVKDFLKLCETKLKAYTKQDLVSQALLEFVRRYK